MGNALEYCSIKLYVHFLDLYQEIVPNLPDDWEGKQAWHEKSEEFERKLWDIKVDGAEISEVCMSHQCWLSVDVDYEHVPHAAEELRNEVKSLLTDIWG